MTKSQHMAQLHIPLSTLHTLEGLTENFSVGYRERYDKIAAHGTTPHSTLHTSHCLVVDCQNTAGGTDRIGNMAGNIADEKNALIVNQIVLCGG